MLRPHPKYPYFNVGRQDKVVYYAWHDIPCVRSYTKPRNPRTKAQQANRNLHARLTGISGETKEFRQFCYGNIVSYRSSHTAFIGLQMCQLHRVQHPVDRPVQAQLRWGRGNLPAVKRMRFSWKEHPVLKWECDKRKLTRQTDPDNRALWMVWNADRDEWHWSLNGGKRRDEETSLNLPEKWKGEELYIWLLFYDPKKGRFSSDASLHVKRGDNQALCGIVPPTLFTSMGYLFEELVLLWFHFRSLSREDKKEFQEDYFP